MRPRPKPAATGPAAARSGARVKPRAHRTAEAGQSMVLAIAALCAILVGALVLGAVARGIGVRSQAQKAADLAALAGARAMLTAYPRLFEPAYVDGRPNPSHIARGAYLQLGRAAALRVAQRNGGATAAVSFPDADAIAPARIRVEIAERVTARRGKSSASTEVAARAEAELSPVAMDVGPGAGAGEYSGPLATRQGKRMRPDVAAAFDRLAAAAARDGVTLIVNSAYRSDAEQAVLFARHPDPKWVAPPGRSLHRYGTELDLGPASAYAWLDAHAPRFGFTQRYSWEDWHWGYVHNARSSPRRREDADGRSSMPGFVPAAYAPAIASAAQRHNVSATLLAAQLYKESNFDPGATSPVGAQGIAQFMPATARAYGLDDPFDAERAIDAQARMMRDLLRQFASVPLALAAYNAGPGRVAACGCVPPIPETTAYVAAILALMSGAGETGGATLAVRLVA